MIESIHARIKSVSELSQAKMSDAIDYVCSQREKINQAIHSNENWSKLKSRMDDQLAETRGNLANYYKVIRNRIGS
jgi:hypothetical protein